MKESPFNVTSRRNMEDTVSARTFNMIIGGITLYGLLTNAIMVVMCHEFAMSLNPWTLIIGYFVSCIVGTIMTNSKSPAVSFVGYNLIVIPIGLILSICVPTYNIYNIAAAAVATGAVTLLMMVLAAAKPDFFLGMGRTLFIALCFGIIAEIISMFFGYGGDIFNWAFVIIFSLYIGFDWSRAQVMSKTLDNAVDAAVQIYLDIINLFIRLLKIMGKKK